MPIPDGWSAIRNLAWNRNGLGFGSLNFRIPRNSGGSRDLTLLEAPEQITPNRVVRNCQLFVIGLRLFLGKIDHDDLRVFAQAVEDDLFSVAGDVEGPHGRTFLKPGKWPRLHRSKIESQKSCDASRPCM